MKRSTYNKIEGLKKAIEIVKSTERMYMSSCVDAIQKEIDRLETIERDQANVQRVDAQNKRIVITNNKEESLLYKDIYRNLK